jgi:arylsulfatase A-like enzyme
MRKKFVQKVEQRLPDEIGDWLSGDLSLEITDIPSPPHIQTPQSVQVLRFQSDTKTSRYMSGVPVRSKTRYVVSPNGQFRQLELPLIGVSKTDVTTVEAEFESPDGNLTTDTFRFENHDQFTPSERIEVVLKTDNKATEATVTVDATGLDKDGADLNAVRATVLNAVTGRTFVPSNQLWAGVPVVHQPSAGPPILLLSIDTLRWDRHDELEPLISALGGEDTIVDEPRTQGHWTAPSHGSMFTGVHPGDHRYVGLDQGATEPINSNLTTISDVLGDQGYKMRWLVSHTRILPEVGFGHGFFQYRLENMGNWLTREFDASKKINTMIDWIDRDKKIGRSNGTFYFLHVFDPHSPYVPPLSTDGISTVSLRDVNRFQRNARDTLDPSTDTSADALDPDIVKLIQSYYDASVSYTATQVRRLLDHLKQAGIFEKSLIIVTGDHGEEFGEQGIYKHQSLYDGNIRPFMAVKPPDDAMWDSPAVADTIDILPTIAETVGSPVPSDCQGVPWQYEQPRPTRISERIRPDWYNVAIERDGIKGIFTYEENYPNLPTKNSVEQGALYEEYYSIEDLRNGIFEETKPDPDLRQQLAETSRDHASRTPIGEADQETYAEVTQDTEQRLEHLGYR